MKKYIPLIFLGVAALATLALIIFLLIPGENSPTSNDLAQTSSQGGFSLTSPDFIPGSPIPIRFTCDGEDIPPTIVWSGEPAGTASFVLIMDDPDAPSGIWTHWIVYNLTAETHGLDALVIPGVTLNDLPVFFGKNSWESQVYGGPCPPSGTHNYIFQLYSLDEMLSLPDNLSKAELEIAIGPHVLAFVELVGTYTR
jgi:Raf kinase inhibitor-like YbhB/YbcL family protein